MDIILDTLNDEQRQAVFTDSKYLQIIAGPGTGKTSTLAARILHLQYKHGLSRPEVLAISFSRSAKQQLIKKLQEFTGNLGYGSVVEILTFHSLAHRIIRYGIFHGESKFKHGFKTVDTIDLIKHYPSIINGLCSNYLNVDLVAKAITQSFNMVRQGIESSQSFCEKWSDINPEQIFKIDIDATERININGKDLIEFWKRIDQLEKEKNITDFQGLITETIHLLNLRSHTYNMVTNDLRHILVDEYQDTSLGQEELLFSLAGETIDLTVVGDKNQTIYTFNGSNETNLDRFIARCGILSPSQIDQIQLKKNYRSSPEIVNLSNYFIGEEIIEATRESSSFKPVLVNTQSTKLAASYIAKEIQDLCRINGYNYNEVCILFRKNSEYAPQADDVIQELNNYNIPYQDALVKEKEKKNLESEIQKLSDHYPGTALHDILAIIKEKGEETKELVKFIMSGIDQGIEDIDDLLDLFVEENEAEEQKSENKVTIQTLHAAKGQEFQIVFIVYLGDRHFPHGSKPNIQEERRLLYVGMTRAKKKLYILGQHGIHQEDFLGQCKSPETTYVYYNNANDELIGSGFSDIDEILIKETENNIKTYEEKQSKRLQDMMSDW